MTDANVSRATNPQTDVARWNLTLANLASNDNEPPGMRAGTMAPVLGMPLASTTAVAACLRFLL